jgi:hypothetical protein
MLGARFPTPSILAATLALLLIVLAAIVLVGRLNPGVESGQVWRRGFLSGDQVVLGDDGRYAVQRWGYFGPTETIESGVWVQLGDTVSLVPSNSGSRARVMRKRVDGDQRYLYEPTARSDIPEQETWYERVD